MMSICSSYKSTLRKDSYSVYDVFSHIINEYTQEMFIKFKTQSVSYFCLSQSSIFGHKANMILMM